jgi:hypothetical protein
MKKNLTIIILAIAFVTSFSWNWIGKAKANSDPVGDAAAAINTYVGNGGVFSGVAGGGGRMQISFGNAPNQAASFLVVTIVNIDDEDISYVVDP